MFSMSNKSPGMSNRIWSNLQYPGHTPVMGRFGTLKLFIAVSLLGGVCHCWDAYVRGPVKAIKGSCVLVPCTTIPYKKVIWYKYKSMGYPVVYSQDHSEIMAEFKGRTSVPGYSYDGNCSLRIDNVQQQDSEVDLYVWIWGRNGEDKGFYDRTIKINVLNFEQPTMSVTQTQTEGKAFTATCTCRHSCPSSPAQISWLGLTALTNSLTHEQDGQGLWVTKATGTFKVSWQNQDTALSCRCALSGGSELQSNSVSLRVLYAPTDVKIYYTGSSTVDEGKEISVECSSKGNPQPTNYEWRVNRVKMAHLKGSLVVLKDVRRHTSVSCIATNSVGQGESQQLSLNVFYAPTDVKVDYTGSSSVVEGKAISLECTSKSRPEPTQYDWVITQNGTTTHLKGRTVVLEDVMRGTAVSCMATNNLGRGESEQLSLTVHYSPSILPSSSCSTQNGKLRCTCQAEAKPSPVISWTVDGSDVLSSLFNTTTEQNGSVTVSELTGSPVHNVSCMATNSVGTKFTQIPLHSEGYALLTKAPWMGGVTVVCVIGFAVIAFIFWKKRRHAEPCEDLGDAQHVKSAKICHDYYINPGEDLYANSAYGQQAYKDQESCIYENYN